MANGMTTGDCLQNDSFKFVGKLRLSYKKSHLSTICCDIAFSNSGDLAKRQVAAVAISKYFQKLCKISSSAKSYV
jgi:hypothetical protein